MYKIDDPLCVQVGKAVKKEGDIYNHDNACIKVQSDCTLELDLDYLSRYYR